MGEMEKSAQDVRAEISALRGHFPGNSYSLLNGRFRLHGRFHLNGHFRLHGPVLLLLGQHGRDGEVSAGRARGDLRPGGALSGELLLADPEELQPL